MGSASPAVRSQCPPGRGDVAYRAHRAGADFIRVTPKQPGGEGAAGVPFTEGGVLRGTLIVRFPIASQYVIVVSVGGGPLLTGGTL